jgi:hypothetical protein
MREDSKRKERIVQQYWEALQRGDVDHVDFLEEQYIEEKATRDATATSTAASTENANTNRTSVTVDNIPVTADENTMDAEGENESFDAVGAGENEPFNTVGANNAVAAGNAIAAGNAFNVNIPTGFGTTPAFNNVANYGNGNGNGIGFGNGYQGLSNLLDQDGIGSFGLSTSSQLMLNQPQANSAFQANQVPGYGLQNSLFCSNQTQNNQSDNTTSLSKQVQDSNFQINPYLNNPFINNNFVSNNFPTSNNNLTNNNLVDNNLANSVPQPEQDQIGDLTSDNSGLQQSQEVQYPVYESPTNDALVHNTQASQAFSPSVTTSGNDNQNMSFAGFNTVPANLLSNPSNMNAAQPNNLDFDQASEFPPSDLLSFDHEL